MSIPRSAIGRPVTMFMLSAVIILLGAVSLSKLPVDLMPDMQQPTLTVRVTYVGVGPREIEETIVRPVEQALSAVSGLDQINSSAMEGSANIRLNFTWGQDLDVAADDVRSRLDRVRGRLPEDADAPIIFKFDSNAMPIVFLAVEGDHDEIELREIAQNELSPRLERVSGVASVDVNGGLRRQIRVELSREKITALGLSVDRVVNLLRTENQNIPVGEVDEGDLTYLLRSQGQFANLEDIRGLVVLTRENVPVYLRDIAEVRDAAEDVRAVVRVNGKPGVRMSVTKQSGTNTVQVAAGVRAEVERINRDSRGIRLTVVNDTSRFIQSSISAVQEHVFLGSFLVVALIFLFLRSPRSTLIICTSIPISIIGTFALLYFGGYTLNTMTFGGLALGVGMIVDAAIVVLENTHRHMDMGKGKVQAAIDGSEEIWSAILASTLTHIAVFVPLFFLTGVSSVMFKELSIVVMFSLAMSLFVAVTLVPVLCSMWMKLPKPADQRKGITGALYNMSERMLEGLDDAYRAFLHKALEHRPTVLLVAASSFALAIWLIPTLNFELMPQADEGEVQVDAELPVGTRIERTQAAIVELEEMIKQSTPEATSVIASAGGQGGGPMGGGRSNRASLQVMLVPKDERTRSNEQIALDLRTKLAVLPGVIVRARASGGNFQMMRMFGGNGDGRLSLEIRGHELEDSNRVSLAARDLMNSTPGVVGARLNRDEGRPELSIRVDRDKAALLGLSVSGVANTLRTNVAGTQAAFYRDRGNEYPIVVRLREEDRSQISSIGDILVSTPGGRVVPARNLLQIADDSGPTQINRKNQERISNVSAEIEVPLSDAVKAIESRLGELRVPADFQVGFGAEVEEQAKAFSQLQLLLVLAIALVYAVMASQYESLRDPFIIMFSIPLAAIGVVGTLKLTNTPFSMQAYIGVIMLAGIVVSNAILLVDYTNVLRRRDGLGVREAVELAGRTRLRPILMTTLCTVLGLVPMSLGIGEGSELQVPLARVVIGGLVTSTLITLVFVPTLYTFFEEGLGTLLKPFRSTPIAPAQARGIEG